MPVKEVDIQEFLAIGSEIPIVDVRTPKEFLNGHIPEAVNIPLFSDEERVVIGKMYKQTGREEAIEKGLEITGPKISILGNSFKSLSPAKKVRLHCWRGGMRSGSVASLLAFMGFEVFLLKKGYKAYRNYVINEFEKLLKLVVVGGETGAGKTKVLQQLKLQGYQVVDLEALANHKGSAFGDIGKAGQPFAEQFENNLFEVLKKINTDQLVFIEDESKSIGRVYIPNVIWEKMKKAPLIYVQIPKQERIFHLKNDYIEADVHSIKRSLEKISKRLGNEAYKKCMIAIEENNMEAALNEVLNYYDKAYVFNHEKRIHKNIYRISFEKLEPVLIARDIIKYINQNPKIIIAV